MWKRYMVIVGGAALVLSLPMAATAFSPNAALTPDMDVGWVPMTTELELQVQEQVWVQTQDPVGDPVTTQDQVMTRERVREHIKTGPIDDPAQKQLRLHEQVGAGDPDARRGNPDAPMIGDGTGDCLMDGEPQGTGPHGPGAGRNG